MSSLASLTAFLALTATVIANPIDKRSKFSIEQVQHKIFAKNGAQSVVNTLRKFGKPVPENLLKAAVAGPHHVIDAAQAQSGSDPATPEDAYDSLYLSPVTIGTSKPTTLNLDFDTGSADLWVFSSLQSASQRSGHDYYTVDSSKVLSGDTWSISYGDGSSASGKVYADKVVVGGVTATSQAVEAATSVSSSFASDTDDDGLLGLAFSSINTVSPTPQNTFFDNVKSSLASPLFAVTLKYHAAGTYDFGYIDSSKYTGSITYTNVDSSQGFWQFSMTGYSIGTGSQTSTSINGIADTGTTLLYLPTSVVKAYYAKVSGSSNSASAGGYVFPCSTTPPDFSLYLNGAKLRVPGKYINYAPIQEGSSSCFGGIQVNTGIGFSIFGDIFLKSKYAVFENSGSPRIGFADQPNL